MVQRGDETGSAVSRRPPIYKDLVLLQLAALVFLTDQFTKFLVREFLERHESFPEHGFFRITHAFNTGSAFGLFRDQNIPLILASAIGISILVLIYRSQRRPSGLLRLSLGLQLGGAAGNLLDRLRLGHVTDFVDVGAWPIFNVADASIVAGLLILVWIFLGTGRCRETTAGAGVAPPREDTGLESKVRAGYAWCPVCDGDMQAVLKGWKCSSCGARERVDPFSADLMASGLACPRDGTPAGPTNQPEGAFPEEAVNVPDASVRLVDGEAEGRGGVAPAPAGKEGELGEFPPTLGEEEISPRPGAPPMGG